MVWQWTYDGGVDEPGSPSFPGQADAEGWLGDHWRDLLDSGVAAVTLTEDGRTVYGPMSLEPA